MIIVARAKQDGRRTVGNRYASYYGPVGFIIAWTPLQLLHTGLKSLRLTATVHFNQRAYTMTGVTSFSEGSQVSNNKRPDICPFSKVRTGNYPPQKSSRSPAMPESCNVLTHLRRHISYGFLEMHSESKLRWACLDYMTPIYPTHHAEKILSSYGSQDGSQSS